MSYSFSDKVEEALLASYSGFQFEPYIVVMCMLVQEGADPTLKNRNGQSPLVACTPDVAMVVRTMAQIHGSVGIIVVQIHTAKLVIFSQ